MTIKFFDRKLTKILIITYKLEVLVNYFSEKNNFNKKPHFELELTHKRFIYMNRGFKYEYI